MSKSAERGEALTMLPGVLGLLMLQTRPTGKIPDASGVLNPGSIIEEARGTCSGGLPGVNGAS